MTHTEIITAIIAGHADDYLDDIKAACKQRIAHKARSVRPGQPVTIQNARPQYLNGLTATVVRHNRQRTVIKIDPALLAADHRLARWSGEITCPPEMISV